MDEITNALNAIREAGGVEPIVAAEEPIVAAEERVVAAEGPVVAEPEVDVVEVRNLFFKRLR